MAELPEYIGKYKIESLVARGGMGAVLKAVHPTLKRHVVLKKLTIKGSSAIAERFKREARILMDFKHDNIVQVFDHFKEGSSYYMVLEYVDGMSLDQLIKKQRFLTSELSLTILLQVCKALAYAHSMGVIHRDIIKLADFGIAASEDEDDSGLTKEGMTLGTPCYMPPEQIENSKNVDKRADIYSVGVMLYEMVTGKKPYPGNFSAETLVMIRKGHYRKASKINGRIHSFVDTLIKKLMQPSPARRFQDVDKLVAVIEKYLRRYKGEPIANALTALMHGSIAEEPRYPRARRKRSVLPLLFILLASLAAGAWYVWHEGYAYRWVMPDSYGELRLSVRVPKSGKRADEVFVKARLFIDDGKEMPESKASPLALTLLPIADSDPYYSLESQRVFLAPGLYRLKLMVGGTVRWECFRILPFSAPEGSTGLALHLRTEEEGKRPLSVTASARDAATGLEVPSRLKVMASGSWTSLEELPEDWLTTAAVRQFRVEADGYESQVFSLKIAADHDRLILSASLPPLGGQK